MLLCKTAILGVCMATLAYGVDVSVSVDADQKRKKRKNKRQSSTATSGSGSGDSTSNPMHKIGYFKKEAYQSKTKEDKMDDLWTMITEDTTMIEPFWDKLDQIFTNKPNGSFCQNSDEMQKRRVKSTHQQGLVAQFSWIPVAGDYTGFYAEQSDHNIIRFSQTTNLHEESEGLLPSVALKFLIDGAKSQNVFGMPSFKETDSWDFFESPMRSRVDPFEPADASGENDQCLVDTIQKKLVEGTKWPFSTAVSNIANTDASGAKLSKDQVRVPWEIQFTSDFKGHEYEQTDGRMWHERLMEIGTAGTTILNVLAVDTPNTEPFKIAEIKLITDLTTSKFGDERLHFQHVRTGRDRKFWTKETKKADKLIDPKITPRDIHDWDVSAWPSDDDDEAHEFFMDQIEESGCPFAWLLWPDNNTVVTETKNKKKNK